MPGYRRVRYVDRPTYYTNTPGFPGPIYIGVLDNYYYKVSEVIATTTIFAAELNQWYLNDTGANISYTNTSGGFIQVFDYNPSTKVLHIDRIMANGTKIIYSNSYFATYNTAEQYVPIYDVLGQAIFNMVDTNGETSDSRYRGIQLTGTLQLFLYYKRYVVSATPEESRTVTGFQFNDPVTNNLINEINEYLNRPPNNVDNDDEDEYRENLIDLRYALEEPSSKREN